MAPGYEVWVFEELANQMQLRQVLSSEEAHEGGFGHAPWPGKMRSASVAEIMSFAPVRNLTCPALCNPGLVPAKDVGRRIAEPDIKICQAALKHGAFLLGDLPKWQRFPFWSTPKSRALQHISNVARRAAQPSSRMNYVAPEVLRQRYCLGSCDMWSLGVIVFVLLSGEMPFQGAS